MCRITSLLSILLLCGCTGTNLLNGPPLGTTDGAFLTQGVIESVRGHFAWQEWSAEPIRGRGIFIWRLPEQALDSSPVDACWVEMNGDGGTIVLHVFSGQNVGCAILSLEQRLGVSATAITDGRPPLVAAVEAAAGADCASAEWLRLGTIDEAAPQFVGMIPRLAVAIGLGDSADSAKGDASAMVRACDTSELLQDLGGAAGPEAETAERTICVRSSAWGCTTGPVTLTTTSTAGGQYCNYTQVTTCTSTEDCYWIVCDTALWTWSTTSTWSWSSTTTTGPQEGPCAPAGTVTPPPPPPPPV
jgi:hypothetical protein